MLLIHPVRALALPMASMLTTGLLLAGLLLTGLLCTAAPATAAGFPNVPQTPGALLSGLNAPNQGRTAIIAYHNGLLFTLPELPSSEPGSDFLVRTWDLANPAAPAVLATHGVSPQPINAHGYFKSGEYLVVGSNYPPESPWSFRAEATFGQVTRTMFPALRGIGVRGQLFQHWYAGPTYWSYGEIGGNATLEFDGQELASWDHLGTTGVIGHPFILGDLLIFASDQSRTGVATYDISDPANPVLLDVLKTGGPGGYWPELWGGDGKLLIVFPYRTGGNGIRVVDATDPSDLRFIADRPLPGDAAMYMQFQDEYAFTGSHKVDMRTFESVLFLDGANIVRTHDGGVGIDTSQFALPLGNLLVTGGVGPYQGMAIWAHQAAPDTRGPAVGYHIPQAGRTNYPVGAPISLLIHETLETATLVSGSTFIVRPLGGAPIPGHLIFSFDDVLTFTPDDPLLPDTTYEVLLPAGGIEDAAGNGMVGYSFTFSTGAAVGGNQPPVIDSLTASLYPAAPGQSVALQASASDPDTEPVEYRFDYGDGTPKTAWTSGTGTSHAYAAPGHYQAAVQARDAAGAIATRTVQVTVLTSPGGTAPTRGSPIYCDAAGRRVWTVNPDNDTLSLVDPDGLALLAEVATCDDPRGVALAGTGELWVACHDDDRLFLHDAASGAFLAEIDTEYGSGPIGLAASPSGGVVYVALQSRGELRRYNAATRQETGRLAVGPTPRALAVTGDGARVLVSRFLSPRNRAEVYEVDAATFTLLRTLVIPKFGGELHRDTTADGRGVANYLAGLAVSPDNSGVWVASNKPNFERGSFFALDLDQDNTVRNVASRLDLESGAPAGALDLAIDVDNSDSAAAAAYSPLGDYLFVALQGNNEVVVLDALDADNASGLGSLVTRLGSGLAPQGLCLDEVTGRLFVKNLMDRGVTVFETDDLFRFGDASIPGTEIGTVLSEALPPQVLLGKQIFYNASDPRMSAEGYISCATCHADGGHDGRVWDFTGRGEGFRNTTTLRGRAGTGHGNVHWTANFDEIHDFENDIRGAFGGRGLMDDADFSATSTTLGPPKAGLSSDLDALAAYVASLTRESLPKSPHRAANGALTAEGQAGQEIFRQLDCGSCHAGNAFTDSTLGSPTLHNVGTLRTTSGQRLGGPLTGIDAPTLLGVWNTSPYLHDGSASTLEDVFRIAGGSLLQAEDAAPSGGAGIVTNYVDLNNDDTVHGRAYAELGNGGARLTFTGVDGGPAGLGGTGAVELRYSAGYHASTLEIRVNGALQGSINLPTTGNDPPWRHTNWETVRLESVGFAPGAVNTLELRLASPSANLSIDDVLVTTAGHLAAAEPHRRVLGLPAGDQAALLAYLRQLDQSPEENPAAEIFLDGFEAGNASRWSSIVAAEF